VLRNGADGVKRALTGDGILLAGELLGEQFDGPAKIVRKRAMAG
jgi:hypothetical protein